MLVNDLKSNSTKTATKTKFAPVVPGDHGAYVMLLVPLLIGTIAGAMQRNINFQFLPVILLILTMVAGFFVYEPLDKLTKANINPVVRQQAKLWLAIYAAIGVITGLMLLLIWQKWALLLFGCAELLPMVAYLISKKWRKQRSLPVRLAGIAGLVLSEPAAYYIVTNRIDGLAIGLWVANVLYFGSQLFYVRAWFEAKKQLKQGLPPVPAWLLRATFIFLALGFLILIGFVVTQILPWQVLLAFAPLAVKLAMGLRKPPINIPLIRIGLFELVQSLIFALLLLLPIYQNFHLH